MFYSVVLSEKSNPVLIGLRNQNVIYGVDDILKSILEDGDVIPSEGLEDFKRYAIPLIVKFYPKDFILKSINAFLKAFDSNFEYVSKFDNPSNYETLKDVLDNFDKKLAEIS